MTNQQLLDYIRQQQQQGVDAQTIKETLLTSGWQAADIDAALQSTQSSVPLAPQRNSHNRWLWVGLLVILGVALCAAIAYGVYRIAFSDENPVVSTNDTNSTTPARTEEPEADRLELDISTPKNVYIVDESFSGGRHLLTYQGEPMRVIVLYEESRKDIARKSLYGKVAGRLVSGTFEENPSLAVALQPFYIDEQESRSGGDAFEAAGEYQFKVSIFACEDLGIPEEDCGARIDTDRLLQYQPRATATKTILVIDNPATMDSTADSSSEAETPPVTAQKSVLDCYNADYTEILDADCALGFSDEFFAVFDSCSPAQGTVGIGLEPALGVFRGYEITGEQQGRCHVTFTFLDVPLLPAELKQKEMYCAYGSGERTGNDVSSTDNCSGPLYDALQTFRE